MPDDHKPIDQKPYQEIPIKDNNEPLVDLASYDFVLSPEYFNAGYTPEKNMFLRKGTADRIAAAQTKLKIYRFKIWDGWRPRTLQNKLYQITWDETAKKHSNWSDEQIRAEVNIYVAEALNPSRIPPHSTGGTVDLTLVDEKGKELDMGTVFDHFGMESASDYFERNDTNLEARTNRRLLKKALLDEGFNQYTEEWWHFDYGNQVWAFDTKQPFAFYGEILKS